VARPRDPRRDEAKKIWLEFGREKKLKDIAEELDVTSNTIRKWKATDRWEDELKESAPISKRSAPKRHGAPKGNKNALGNIGGAPPKNSNAVSHGFFRTIFPDDEETKSIINEIGAKSPIDMLWENIVIQYTAIARAQKVMFVESKQEMIKELKKSKFEVVPKGDNEFEQVVTEEEYEFQFSWDRHATFLTAQSRAISTLQALIKQYEDMCRIGRADEEQQMRLDKLKAEVKALGIGKSKEPLRIEIDYGDDES
jgi:uncharacterized protein YjcR